MKRFSKNKRIVFAIVYSAVSLLILGVIFTIQYRDLNLNYNIFINSVYSIVGKYYPDVDRAEIIESMAEPDMSKNYLIEYGIDVYKDSALETNNTAEKIYLAVNVGVVALLLIALFIVMNYIFRCWDKELVKLTEELSRINRGDYSFDLVSENEGKLGILENEMYKTAIKCRESADNSQKDKMNLKESLSDISHQIKTPLTSLLINLDNLDEFKDMSEDKRQMLIDNSRREANKINQLIQLLLKLSRLDADAIEFERKKTSVEEILLKSAENVSALCDLKGIDIIFCGQCVDVNNIHNMIENCNQTPVLFCDPYWETEAVSNIIKNGVEHALTKIELSYSEYGLYTDIIIENDGKQISDEDAKQIFTRYYRGEIAAADSVGIGLSLADGIIKKDDGYIIAEGYTKETDSGTEEGTRFTLRYFRGKE